MQNYNEVAVCVSSAYLGERFNHLKHISYLGWQTQLCIKWQGKVDVVWNRAEECCFRYVLSWSFSWALYCFTITIFVHIPVQNPDIVKKKHIAADLLF